VNNQSIKSFNMNMLWFATYSLTKPNWCDILPWCD